MKETPLFMFLYYLISNIVDKSWLFGFLIDDSFYFCIILINVVFFLLLDIFLSISKYLYPLFPEFLHLLQRRPSIDVAFIIAQLLLVGLPLFVQKIILVSHFWRLFHLSYHLLVARPSEDLLFCNSKAELIAHFDVQLIPTLAFLSKYTILSQKILIFI